MSDDRLIRVQNLNGLCAQRDWGPADLVREAGSSYSYWRDLLLGYKSFGEKAARSIEERLGLTPCGVLDQPGSFDGHSKGHKPTIARGRAHVASQSRSILVHEPLMTRTSAGEGGSTARPTWY
jgi:hypothetical protein